MGFYHFPLLVDVYRHGEHRARALIPFQERHGVLYHGRRVQVVGMIERRILAGGELYAAVEVAFAADILRMLVYFHAGIFRGVPGGELERIIGGSVVDDKDGDVPVSLGQDGVQGFRQSARRVIRGNADAHQGPGRSAHFFPPAVFSR